MNISKDQIVQLLESQGNHDKAQQADQQLPDQVDTRDADHVELLSKLGIDPNTIAGKAGVVGNL